MWHVCIMACICHTIIFFNAWLAHFVVYFHIAYICSYYIIQDDERLNIDDNLKNIIYQHTPRHTIFGGSTPQNQHLKPHCSVTKTYSVHSASVQKIQCIKNVAPFNMAQTPIIANLWVREKQRPLVFLWCGIIHVDISLILFLVKMPPSNKHQRSPLNWVFLCSL